MPHGVHAKDQTAFRLDPDLRARLKGASEEDGRTMTDVVSEAITDWLDRRDGITTGPVSPPQVPPVTFKPGDRSPLSASEGSNDEHRTRHALTCKCMTCKQTGGQ